MCVCVCVFLLLCVGCNCGRYVTSCPWLVLSQHWTRGCVLSRHAMSMSCCAVHCLKCMQRPLCSRQPWVCSAARSAANSMASRVWVYVACAGWCMLCTGKAPFCCRSLLCVCVSEETPQMAQAQGRKNVCVSCECAWLVRCVVCPVVCTLGGLICLHHRHHYPLQLLCL